MPEEPTRLVRPEASEGRLLLVSNRLPITIKRSDEGKYDMSMSSGGLVSGLSGLAKTTTFQWYGWPGLEVPEDETKDLNDQLKKKYNAVPVMLDDELADRHYNGFSSEAPLASTIFGKANPVQTRLCGRSSTTTPVRLPSTSLPGMHIPKPTVYSPRRSQRTYKTTTWFGCMITT